MTKLRILFSALFFVLSAPFAQAETFSETFSDPFASWETEWLGIQSNLSNFYVIVNGFPTSYRGNNPDGLWLGGANITFNSAFGSTIQFLSLDVASYQGGILSFYDSNNTLISSFTLNTSGGATSIVGNYQHFSVTSSTGISRFEFTGGIILGNTSIDNVVVSTVPEPESFALLLAGLGVLGAVARKRKLK
jgi:hypothetical protein